MIERRQFHIVLVAFVVFLTILPFLILSPVGFWESGFMTVLTVGFSPDRLTVATLWYAVSGMEPNMWWSLLVGAFFAGWTFWMFRKLPGLPGYLFAITITSFAIFLFGKQAFLNYYYFIECLLIFLLALHTSSDPLLQQPPGRASLRGRFSWPQWMSWGH